MKDQKNKDNLSREKWGRIEIEFPSKTHLFLLLAIVVPYLIATGFVLGRIDWHPSSTGKKTETNQVATTSAPSAVRGIPLSPGPWGDMAYRRIFIQSPEDFLTLDAYESSDPRWFFGGENSRSNVLTQLTQSGLNSEQRRQLENASWAQTTNGLYLTPPTDFTLSLNPSTRQKIYTLLAHYTENPWQHYPCFFPAGNVEDLFAKDNLSLKSLALLKQLAYPHAHLLFFADLPLALHQIGDPAEKMRFAKAVSRRSTLLTGVRVNPDSNVDTLLAYWARAGQGKDLRPLLEGISKTPGAPLPLMAILPVRAASRLFTFASPAMIPAERENPHWSAFNFFRDPPDDRYSDAAFMKQKLESDFYPVFSDPAYGDLVFLMTPAGGILHSSVFIADNIVYTKCGGQFVAPWLLMTIPEMQEAFATMAKPDEQLKIMYYRNKYY